MTTNCRQRGDFDCDRPSTADYGARPKTKTGKGFQRIKHEIDRQNITIAKLEREIDMKAMRGFPSPCLRPLQSQLCAEQKKLQAMIQKSKDKQARVGCSSDCWESPRLSFNRDSNSKPLATASSNLEFCESILNDNENLDDERNQLQEELLCKDDKLQDFEDKIECLQSQLIKICHENQMMTKKLEESQSCTNQSDVKSKIESIVANGDKLSTSIYQLESNLSVLRNDLSNIKKDKKIAFDFEKQSQKPSCTRIKSEGDSVLSQPPKSCPCNQNQTQAADKLKCLESQYLNLQTEYCRKEKESKEMVERMKKCLDNCKGDKERAENEALKNRADELVAEISDYKIFSKELQEQVDIYREKFMKGE